MVAAAIALISLQTSKAAFDKKQNATYQLVGDAKLTPNDESHTMPVDAFATAVRKRVAPEDGHLAGGVDAFSVVKKCAEEASHQSFKNRIELSTKLTEGINKQKNEWLKRTREAYDSALVAEAGYDRLRTRASNQLQAIATDGIVDVASALKDAKSESPLSIALKENNELRARKDVPLAEVTVSVDKFYKDKKAPVTTDRTDLARDIAETEDSFQKLISSVNEELRFQMEPSAAERAQTENVLFFSAHLAQPNSTLALVLDDKQGIAGVYWLLRVALTGIVLFALLYLILIPLKHLFFWTASGDVLTEYVKKLLESKTSVVGPTVARAAMVTVAAATVAGGAAMVANGLPFTGPSDRVPDSAVAIAASPNARPRDPGDGRNNGDKNPGGTTELKEGIASLTQKVTELEFAVRNIPGSTTVYRDYTDVALANSVKELITNRLGTPGPSEPTTLFSSLGELQRKQTGFENVVKGRFTTIDDLIGTQADQLPVKQSLFGKLNGVSETLGTRSISAITQGSPSDPTVIESLRKLGASNSTDSSTLFGRMSAVDRSVDNVFKTAGSIRRDQLGSGGRNLLTQSKTLFSSERYRVSQSAFDEIARALKDGYPGLRNNLKNLISDDKEYSEGELRRQLGPIPDGWWNKWKSTILRYTRVARY
jgi:hypothetical protein